MSWTHSSKAVALGLLLVVALGAAGTAAAVSFAADDPEAAEVGDTVEFEVEVTDVYDGQPDQWTLEGETELEDPSWDIVATDVGGDEVARSTTSEFDIDRDDNIDTVTVEIQGDVPEMTEFNYESPEDENYVVLELSEADGAVLQDWSAHRFTEDSQDARQAIDDASEAGASDDDLSQAINAYDNANFELAIELADEAREDAESAEQTQTLLLVGGGVVVVLVLLGGGYYIYQQRSQNTNKLQ